MKPNPLSTRNVRIFPVINPPAGRPHRALDLLQRAKIRWGMLPEKWRERVAAASAADFLPGWPGQPQDLEPAGRTSPKQSPIAVPAVAPTPGVALSRRAAVAPGSRS